MISFSSLAGLALGKVAGDLHMGQEEEEGVLLMVMSKWRRRQRLQKACPQSSSSALARKSRQMRHLKRSSNRFIVLPREGEPRVEVEAATLHSSASLPSPSQRAVLNPPPRMTTIPLFECILCPVQWKEVFKYRCGVCSTN